MNKNFLDFAVKLLLKDKKEYMFSFLLFTFIIFILSSVLFISDSIKYELLNSLNKKNQIIAVNTKAGKYDHINDEHLDSILQINGVKNVIGKVDGYYFFSQDKRYFHIISDDSLDDNTMSVSSQVRYILDKFYYKNKFNFLTEDEIIELHINKNIDTNIFLSDAVFVNTYNARRILQMSEDEYSYLDVVVPNDSEIDFIALSIEEKFPNIRTTTKSTMISKYKHIFYYKGGIFMIIYIVAMISFFILLKQQISSTYGERKKEIAILRSIGFAIKDIIYIKFIQNGIIAISSCILGLFLAYFYVFLFDAPLLSLIFIGNDTKFITFSPVINIKIISIIFIFTVIPFLASILIPSWKIAVEDISEVMK